MKTRIGIYIILFAICTGCHKKEEGAVKINNLNCPDFYPEIEGVYWANQPFAVSSDSLHEYWYRIITFSEEEGFNIFVEKLQQGVAEGLGKMEVVERKNITLAKGIADANGISLHYHVKKWVSSKIVLLELDKEDKTIDSSSFKLVNVENLIVKDTICSP